MSGPELLLLTVMAVMLAAATWLTRKSGKPHEEDKLTVHVGRAIGFFPFAVIMSIVLMLAYAVLDFLWVG